MGLNKLSNEELIALIRNGDNFLINELIARFEPFIKKKSQAFGFEESNFDEVIQRGRIAISKAINKFDLNHQTKSKFITYASMCLDNEFKSILSELSKNNNEKAVSHIADFDEEDKNAIMTDTRYNPEEIAIKNESEQELKRVSEEILSNIERKVYDLRNVGYKNGDISKELKISTKSVENALTRIKQKFSKQLREKDAK